MGDHDEETTGPVCFGTMVPRLWFDMLHGTKIVMEKVRLRGTEYDRGRFFGIV